MAGQKIGWRGTDEDRFWSNVVLLASGCWQWTGAVDGKGYGAFTPCRTTPGVPAPQVSAYAWAFQKYRGLIIPGKQLHHECENIRCVSPYHLDQITPLEHVHKSPHNPCSVNASKTHCKNGHPYNAENTYVRKDCRSRTCRVCMREYHKTYRRKL